jgi:ankyrin repeat protein
VNARGQISNETALHIVCCNSGPSVKESVLQIVKMLLDVGAHTHYVNSHGQTPLHIATDTDIRTLLQSIQKLPELKCLYARFITMH